MGCCAAGSVAQVQSRNLVNISYIFTHLKAHSSIISGGGIGGLCLAVALTRFPDVEVAVYEAAGSFKEVGAGVMIWGRTWRVMSLLGLDKVLREIAGVALDGSEGTCPMMHVGATC